MPKRPSLDPEAAVPIRVEVVPRRGLSRHEAARYVGVSVTKLDQMVDEGQMPEPFRIGSRVIYDLKKLDAAFDALSGPIDEIDSFSDWDTTPEPPPAPVLRKSAAKQSGTAAGKMDAKRGLRSDPMPSKEYPGHPNVYSPETLADRWTCSAGHVRKMVKSGDLQAFSSGKLIRITPAVVIAYEDRSFVKPE